MTAVVEGARPKKLKNKTVELEQFLCERNIHRVEVVPDLECDGLITPLGAGFPDGFRMLLKETSEVRVRFTKAHEACHTFFYELVPEVKYRLHETDEFEERLCNFGAAVFLLPARRLLKEAKNLPICLDSLDQLANHFCVSLPTLLLRLKSLRVCHCELSLWHRMTDGQFVFDKVYGGKQADWEWVDDEILNSAWLSNDSRFGTAFVRYRIKGGSYRYKPISYNLRRTATGMLALWGPGITEPQKTAPLFQKPRLMQSQ